MHSITDLFNALLISSYFPVPIKCDAVVHILNSKKDGEDIKDICTITWKDREIFFFFFLER